MGAKGETFARQFEAKAQEATAVMEKLSDADWKKITASEKWPVGVVAHHIAVSHETLAGLIKALADGKGGPNIPMDAIHQMNAKHAQDHAACTKAETLALQKKNVASVAGMLRGIDDAAFDQTGNVLVGVPPMSAGQLAGGLLVGHVEEHLTSIRATVGG